MAFAPGDARFRFEMDMNIQNIKAEIHRLRFEEGMTLQEIAKKYGKSIYWVNARLNKNYEPKRLRQTSDDIGEFEDINVSDKVLSDEVSQIRELRGQGLIYEEIASNLNRSVYWVHTRLQGKYMPKGARAEKQFQEERVVPYMSQLGFTGIRQTSTNAIIRHIRGDCICRNWKDWLLVMTKL
jgi:DNA invertase Pin-like site-specific DNA recombinase